MSLALGNTHTQAQKRGEEGGDTQGFLERAAEDREPWGVIPELSLFSFSSIPGSTARPRVDVSQKAHAVLSWFLH